MIINPGAGGKQETPTISVSAGGLITSAAGAMSAEYQLPTQDGTVITPGTAVQTAVANGKFTTGEVQVRGDSNLKPANIRSGVSIFGIDGAFAGEVSIGEISYDMISTATAAGVERLFITLPVLAADVIGLVLSGFAPGSYTILSAYGLLDENYGSISLQVPNGSHNSVISMNKGPMLTSIGATAYQLYSAGAATSFMSYFTPDHGYFVYLGG